MRRREFIAGLGGAVAWPLLARAQPGERIRRIGVMLGLPENDPEAKVIATALREGLQEAGWIEGHNIRTDYRWAVNNPERSRAAVKELLALSPDVIMPGTTQMMDAVRHANSSVPAIFVNVSDPVGTGFVESLARPGGNITGFTNFEYAMGEKWLQALKEIAPGVTRTAVIANPKNPNTALYLHAIEPAATKFGLRLAVKSVNDAAEIESAIEALAREVNGSLLVMPDPLTLANRDRIIALAARHRLPAAYPFRLFVTSGGLLSYGTDRADLYRRAAAYVDRVLKGAKAGDLPVQQPTKFELVINLKTAAALGLSVPATLLARADEVIE
jgi:putative ABC transport system substrate-binding protein